MPSKKGVRPQHFCFKHTNNIASIIEKNEVILLIYSILNNLLLSKQPFTLSPI